MTSLPKIHQLIKDMIARQRADLLDCARRIEPYVTEDDLLQPNDFPELENHPGFRYDEGVLHGLQTVEMALIAMDRDHS